MFYTAGEVIARWNISFNNLYYGQIMATKRRPLVKRVEKIYKSSGKTIKQSSYREFKGVLIDIIV